jgi:exodeoxyribonuclease VII large subunit
MYSARPLPALIYSVPELTKLVKGRLETDPRLAGIWVRGEIGSFNYHSSGHIFFTLKDEGSSLRCVMFRSFSTRLRFRPESGLGVLAFGDIRVYEQSGSYQFYVRELQPDGLGALFLALEQTRQRLTQEGLFSAERKRPLPRLPRRVGLITSPVGAALQDIIAVSKRRHPGIELVLAPVQVQGIDAPRQIVAALQRLNDEVHLDVIILARGGGSKEDLWTFNDEQVARAVAASKVPVVSAVGHEVDYTLADLAADVRAPTPSAAAELAVPERSQLRYELSTYAMRLREGARQYLERSRQRLERQILAQPWRDPASLLSSQKLALTYIKNVFRHSTIQYLERRQSKVENLKRTLAVLDPLAVLSRGFALVQDGETLAPVTRADQAKPGQILIVKFADSSLAVRVETHAEGDE